MSDSQTAPPNTNNDAADNDVDIDDQTSMFISGSNIVEPKSNETTNITENDVCNFRCIFIALIMYTCVCVYTNYSYY